MSDGPYKSAFRLPCNTPEEAAFLELHSEMLIALERARIIKRNKVNYKKFSAASVPDLVAFAERAGFEFVVSVQRQNPELLGRALSPKKNKKVKAI